MSDLAVVQQMMDRVSRNDLERALDLLGEDVTLTVLRPGHDSDGFQQLAGKEAVRAYFVDLAGIVSFWQLRFFNQESRILVLGRERFTTGGGLEAATDFALVCQLRGELVSEILLVEDLTMVLSGEAGVVEARSYSKRAS
jgi:hypothetical protein